jgi:hypothetical protein
MRDPVEGLREGLLGVGGDPLWSLLGNQRLTLAPPAALPRLVPDRSAGSGDDVPSLLSFGPLSSDAVLRALTYVPSSPGWLERALQARDERESVADLYLVYENDGTGMFPNFGSGSDQGRTAALYLYLDLKTVRTGLTRVGVTAMEMTTPRGTLPAGAPKDSSSRYETGQGPYSGVATIDLGYTVSRSGTSKVDFMLSAGVDSREWGKAVQDLIHEKISDSPVFPWPGGTTPVLEAGVAFSKTIDDLTHGDFAGLSYTGRLELDASVLTGTRRTEATGSARFVIRTAKVHTALGAIDVEFSPLGAFARGFARYNDGREVPLAGIEGGVNASVMVNIGRIGIGLSGEGLVSTDPAFQTDQPAGAYPPALGISPVVGDGFGLPAGAHGTGQLILKLEF